MLWQELTKFVPHMLQLKVGRHRQSPARFFRHLEADSRLIAASMDGKGFENCKLQYNISFNGTMRFCTAPVNINLGPLMVHVKQISFTIVSTTISFIVFPKKTQLGPQAD